MIKYILLILIYTYLISAYNINNIYKRSNIEIYQNGNKLLIKSNNNNFGKNPKLFLNDEIMKLNFNGKDNEIEIEIPVDLLEYNLNIENSDNGLSIPIKLTPKPTIKYMYTIFNNNSLSIIINGEFLGTTIYNKKLNNNNIFYINDNIQCTSLSLLNSNNNNNNNIDDNKISESSIECKTLINESSISTINLNGFDNYINIRSISNNNNNNKDSITLYQFNNIPILIQLFGYNNNIDDSNRSLVYFNTSYYNSNWYLNSSIKLSLIDQSQEYQCDFNNDKNNNNNSILCNITNNNNDNNFNNKKINGNAILKISNIPIICKQSIKYSSIINSFYDINVLNLGVTTNNTGNVRTNKKINAGASLNSNFNIVFATLFLIIVYLF